MLVQWMGLNALIIYAVAACDLLPAALQGFYWRSPENNLVSLITVNIYLCMLRKDLLICRRGKNLICIPFPTKKGNKRNAKQGEITLRPLNNHLFHNMF